jgi:MtN3 and saliva related transmembrane protein
LHHENRSLRRSFAGAHRCGYAIRPAHKPSFNALMILRFMRDDAMTLAARQNEMARGAPAKTVFQLTPCHDCHNQTPIRSTSIRGSGFAARDRAQSSTHGNRIMTLPLMPAGLVEAIGAAGAVLTTLCWVPQALKIIRDRDTRAISLPGTTLCVLGVLLWLVYGLAIVDGPLIGSSLVTFAMTSIILVLKIRHG